MEHVNKRRIGTSFHRHAAEYDRHAVVQKRVVERLERLVKESLTQPPARLLDIGCGTGALLSALDQQYPRTQPWGIDLAFNMALSAKERLGGRAVLVNGDAERLPFQNGAFDLVVSASTLQWVEDLGRCLSESRRVLAPGGTYCAAFFGGKSLWELQESYREALAGCAANERRAGRLHRFMELERVRELFSAAGFTEAHVFSETETEYHPDVFHLLKAIKGVGAGTSAQPGDRTGGLGWRSILQKMSEVYSRRFSCGGVIPATYEVFYLVGKRGL